jgi:hypothetical protein
MIKKRSEFYLSLGQESKPDSPEKSRETIEPHPAEDTIINVGKERKRMEETAKLFVARPPSAPRR